MANAVVSERLEAVQRLLTEYVRVVDGRRLEEWPQLFAREASYFVIPRDNYERRLPLALIYDDSRDRIEDRVLYVRRAWAEHYDEYQPRHLLSVVAIRALNEDEYEVVSNVAIYVTPADGMTQLLAVGEYLDVVVFEGEVPKFREKKVILDTTVLPRSFVYPL